MEKKLMIGYLQEWAVENAPSKEFIFEKAYWDQIKFVRDVIPSILFPIASVYDARRNLKVISTHISKSILLPVYEVSMPEQGITLIMRDNFYDWKISVISKEELDIEFMGLFNEDEEISNLYCEGFPEEMVFGSFSENKKEFTLELRNHYKLHTFLWILKDGLEKGRIGKSKLKELN